MRIKSSKTIKLYNEFDFSRRRKEIFERAKKKQPTAEHRKKNHSIWKLPFKSVRLSQKPAYEIKTAGEKLIAYNFTVRTIEINQAKLKQYDLLLNTSNGFCAGRALLCSLLKLALGRAFLLDVRVVTRFTAICTTIREKSIFLWLQRSLRWEMFFIWLSSDLCGQKAICTSDTHFNYLLNCLYWTQFQSAHAEKSLGELMMMLWALKLTITFSSNSEIINIILYIPAWCFLIPLSSSTIKFIIELRQTLMFTQRVNIKHNLWSNKQITCFTVFFSLHRAVNIFRHDLLLAFAMDVIGGDVTRNCCPTIARERVASFIIQFRRNEYFYCSWKWLAFRFNYLICMSVFPFHHGTVSSIT